MIIDFHTHIFPKKIYRSRDRFFDNEPEFAALYRSPKSRMVTADMLLSAMDENQVDRSVVFGFPWNNDELTERHNDYILEAMQSSGGRLIGFCCVNPCGPNAVEEAERCLKGGMSGVGELAFYQSGFDDACMSSLAPIVEICRLFDCPALIHVNEPVGHAYAGKTPMTLGEILNLVKKFKGVRTVLAHWGGGIFFYNLLKKEIPEILKNVYYDTAASPFLYKADIYSVAAQTVGIDKIIFGSDYPLIRPTRYFDELENSGFTPDERKRVCGENAARLLKSLEKEANT